MPNCHRQSIKQMRRFFLATKAQQFFSFLSKKEIKGWRKKKENGFKVFIVVILRKTKLCWWQKRWWFCHHLRFLFHLFWSSVQQQQKQFYQILKPFLRSNLEISFDFSFWVQTGRKKEKEEKKGERERKGSNQQKVQKIKKTVV